MAINRIESPDGSVGSPEFKRKRGRKRSRSARIGGVVHSAVRRVRNEGGEFDQNSVLESYFEELHAVQIGEPSESFYPVQDEENVVFLEPRRKKKRTKERPGEVLFSRTSETSRVEPDLDVIEGILRDSFDAQSSLMASGRFDAFKGKEDAAFLNAAWSDPSFLELYDRIQAKAVPGMRDFGKQVRGAVFERMSYLYLSSREDKRSVPVFGEDMLHIMQELHPDANVIDNGLLQGLEGVYVPDGLFLTEFDNKVRIDGIIECSLGWWGTKPKKSDQVYGMKMILKDLDPLVFDPKVYIVSPRFVGLNDIPQDHRIDLESIIVPFKQSTFVDGFIPSMLRDFRGANGLTINEQRHSR